MIPDPSNTQRVCSASGALERDERVALEASQVNKTRQWGGQSAWEAGSSSLRSDADNLQSNKGISGVAKKLKRRVSTSPKAENVLLSSWSRKPMVPRTCRTVMNEQRHLKG